MSKEIIALLSKKETLSLGVNDICKKLNIKDKRLLQKELDEMVEMGILDYSSKKKKYLLFENSGLFRGRLVLDKFGNGIIKLGDKEVKILKRDLDGASYNDVVAIAIDDRNDTGVVVRILKRDDSNYVCEVIDVNNKLFINDSRLGTFPVTSDNVVSGSIVLVHHYDGNNEIVSVLGHKDDPGMDMKSIIYEYGFDEKFPDDVMEELNDIPTMISNYEIDEEISNGRVDYRDRLVFTIDGVDTKDIDDAISVRKLDNGNMELTVYIADLSHYIKRGSKLYQEAIKRGTSVYPVNSVIPMFPHKISNGICSINPNTDRFVMAYTTIIDNEGSAIDFKVEEAVINSSMQMNYDDVNKVLSGNMVAGYEKYYKDLLLLQKISLLVEKNLLNNGYLDFMSDEVKILLDDNYNVVDIKKRNFGIAEKIIEYCMIVTNSELSKYAYYLGIPWIYRNHGLPNEDMLIKTVKAMKYNNYLRGSYSDKRLSKYDLQNIMKEIKSMDNGLVFSKRLVTCQDEARYGEENLGHYGLGLDFYSHNTSPIRRAPDLENQIILKTFLHSDLEGVYSMYSSIGEKAKYYSSQERKAKHCEWDTTDLKKCEYMSRYEGEEVVGIISHVTSYGFYVMLDNAIEGFVRIDELPQGRYNYDDGKMSLISRKKIYSVGDKILVKVKRANKENRKIEFTTKDYDYSKIENKNKKKTRKK